MPRVRFEPVGTEVEAQAGESLLDIALDNDIPLQHACGGFCSCTTCLVRVIEGKETLSTKEEDEEERLLETDQRGDDFRLSCQTKVGNRDVTVEIQNLEL